MAEAGLAELQGWFQDRVAGGVWGLDEPSIEGWRAADMVRPSRTLSPAQRVEIYARDYVARLSECLSGEFPVLKALVGETVFNLFAGGYLSACPPRSFTLYDLGAGFADYLEATRPRPHSGPGTMEALPASLAMLERAISVSGRAEGVETSGAGPLDIARLSTPQSLILLRLDFDFGPAVAAARAGRRPDPPPPCDSRIAVARRRYRVQAHVLEPWSFAWLEALARTGGDVAAATADAARECDEAIEAINSRLQSWLPRAAAAGFIVSRPS
jgi:hypothetical protein